MLLLSWLLNANGQDRAQVHYLTDLLPLQRPASLLNIFSVLIPDELVQYRLLHQHTVGLLLITGIVIVGLYSLLSYQHRKQKTYLWFAIYTLAFACTIFTTSTLYWGIYLLGNQLAPRLHLLSFTICLYSFIEFLIHYFNYQFNNKFNKGRYIYQLSLAIFIIIALQPSLYYLQYLAPTISLWIIICLMFSTYLAFNKFRDNQINNNLASTINLATICGLILCTVVIGLLDFVYSPDFAYSMARLQNIEIALEIAQGVLGFNIIGIAIIFHNQINNDFKKLTASYHELTQKLLAQQEEMISTQAQMRESYQAKNIFLINMSRELNMPLNAMMGFTQLMSRSNKRSPEDLQYLELITQSGEHLMRLINDLLVISKIEVDQLSLNTEPFNLHQLLNDLHIIFKSFTVAKGLGFMVEMDHSVPKYLLGDEHKLRQVLINLLSNATKFTYQGEIFLKVRWQEGRGYFEVIDTGIGIKTRDKNRIFAFVNATENITEIGIEAGSEKDHLAGTGLGLYICKKLIQLMDGNIDVKSNEGAGSTFTFDIALATVPDYKPPFITNKVKHLVPGQPALRILLVEDHRGERLLLRELLKSVGFQIREAADGKEAATLCQFWHPHLIWMDIYMQNMDGYEAVRSIRKMERSYTSETNKPAIIIALTGFTSEAERQQALQAGFDDFVPKPYRENTIFEKMAQHLKIYYIYDEEIPGNAMVDINSINAEEGRTIESKFDTKSHNQALTEALSSLPMELITRFYQAIMAGKIGEVNDLLEEIEQHRPEIVPDLRKSVQSFAFDDLIDILVELSEKDLSNYKN